MRLREGLEALAATWAITVGATELPVAEAESVGMSTERLERIDVAMQRHIDAGKIQGAVTGVAPVRSVREAFGTISWSDPAEEIAGVILLQQPYGAAIYDFENAVRQAIID